MPISLVVPIVPVVPVYDKVHMDNLVISIEQTTAAKATLQARIRLYYINGAGDKVFAEKHTDISVPDAELWATEAAMNGDMRGAQAVGNIKALIALLVETHTGWGETAVS